MTLFPGLRGYAAERQLRVPAEASQVMGWLTDSDRREREWLRQVEAQIVAVLAVRTRFPLRWELQQFATVEPAGEATDITVRVQGQMVGIGRVLHLLARVSEIRGESLLFRLVSYVPGRVWRITHVSVWGRSGRARKCW